jgi:hypothetical protein
MTFLMSFCTMLINEPYTMPIADSAQDQPARGHCAAAGKNGMANRRNP